MEGVPGTDGIDVPNRQSRTRGLGRHSTASSDVNVTPRLKVTALSLHALG